MNNLKKKGGTVADLSKALIRKWKDLVPTNDSPKKNASPLNSQKSDFKLDLLPPPRQSSSSKNSSKSSDGEKSRNCTDMVDNRDDKKRKVRIDIYINCSPK